MLEMKVLVVDKNQSPGQLAHRLTRMGITVRVSQDDGSALQLAEEWWPEVVVLDTHVPDMACLNFCRQLRVAARYCGVVLVYSERDNPIDVVLVHEAGADDHISKACESAIVDAKIRRGLQRLHNCVRCTSHPGVQEPFSPSEATSHSEIPAPLIQDLTRLEEQLLARLMKSVSKVVPQAVLLYAGWGNRGRCARLLHDAISRLREKLKPMGWSIVNVRGLGYRLECPEEHHALSECDALCN